MRDRILPLLDHARALVLLVACAGIVFWLDPGSADSLAPKTFCFAAAAGFFAAITAMRLWWGSRLWLLRNRAGLAALGVLAAQLAAFLAAPSRALSESPFNAWLLLLLLGAAAYDWLQEEQRQRLLLYGVCTLQGLASALAIAQYLGFQIGPMDAALAVNFGKRVSAGFGNPNFLGGFLVLTLPCALWLALRKPAAWALVLLGLFTALATGHKAAWLGLSFDYFAWGHLAWHSSRERGARLRFLKRWAAFGLLAACLGLGLMPGARTRLVESLNPNHESVQFRIQTWKGAAAAFGARPVFGHGPGSFSAVYPAFRPDAAMATQVQHSYEVTHPENWVLQLMVEGGLLGLAAFAFFLWLLLKPLWLAALNDDPLALALFLCLAGSLVCNLASLDLFLPSTFFFFTLLSALALLKYGGPSAGIGLKAEPYAAAMLSFCLLFLSSFPALQSLARWKASRSLLAARALSESGSYEEAIKGYDEALQGDPVNTEALYFKAASLLDSGKATEALPVFDELQTLAPDFVLVHDKRARAYKVLGKPNEAAAEWERQLQLDPWMLSVIQDLSGLYASQGKLADAERVLAAAALRFPENDEIRKNLEIIVQRRHA